MKAIILFIVLLYAVPANSDEIRLYFPEDETISSTDQDEKDEVIIEPMIEEKEASPSTVKA